MAQPMFERSLHPEPPSLTTVHAPARAPAGAGVYLHALLRVGAGLLFMQHGAQKLFGVLGGFGGTPGAHAPLASLMGFAGVLEFGGGLLLVLGLLVRPVAALVLIEMLWAYVTVHLPRGVWPLQNQGEMALLYALVFAFLMGNGAGPASIDAALRRARHRND
jgi:putative oxidoreductase